MIYAIRAVGTEFVKIGFTDDETPNGRLAALQVGCPFELKVEAFARGSMDDEARIHKELKKFRVRGEWFMSSPETEMFVDCLRRRISFFDLLIGAMRSGDEGLRESCRLILNFPRESLPQQIYKDFWDWCISRIANHSAAEIENAWQKGNEASAA